MSIISAEFDTKEKSLKVSIDGKEVKNISSVECYKTYMDDDSFGISVNSFSSNEESGISTITRIVASKSGELNITEEKEEQSVELTEQLIKALSL